MLPSPQKSDETSDQSQLQIPESANSPSILQHGGAIEKASMTNLSIVEDVKKAIAESKAVNIDNLDSLERTPFVPASLKTKRGKKISMQSQKRPTSEKSTNFSLSKAKPLDNLPAKAQAKQKLQILTAQLDDKYIAENYYKGFSNNDGDILYERDGVLSRIQ